MTSNIGSAEILEFEGATTSEHYQSMKSEVLELMKHHFRPEFLNRVDETVVFHALEREQLVAIVDIQLERLRRRLAEKRIELELTDEAKRFIAEAGYDPVYGARPIKRMIQKSVETEIARKLLSGEIQEGKKLTVDVQDGRLSFSSQSAVAAS